MSTHMNTEWEKGRIENVLSLKEEKNRDNTGNTDLFTDYEKKVVSLERS